MVGIVQPKGLSIWNPSVRGYTTDWNIPAYVGTNGAFAHIPKVKNDDRFMDNVVKSIGKIVPEYRGTDMEKFYNENYELNHRQRFRDGHEDYAAGNIIHIFDLRDNNLSDVKNKIETKVNEIYTILSGNGPRAWWRRANLISEIVMGDSDNGLVADIENALIGGSITKEYAAKTTDYLRELMNKSMTNNSSFKRALQGSKWEQKAYDNIGIIDMIMDEYGLHDAMRSAISEYDYDTRSEIFEYGIKTEMWNNDLEELEDAIIKSWGDNDRSSTGVDAGKIEDSEFSKEREESGYISWLPHKIGAWINRRWRKAA